MPKISAGLLAYKRTKAGLEFFLVHPGGPFYTTKDLGVWSIPKGEVEDNGNDHLQEAIREFEEETAHKPEAKDFIPLTSLKQKSGKIIHAWAFEGSLEAPFKSNEFELEWPPRSGKKQSYPETDQWEYFDAETAKMKINPGQAGFIDQVLQILEPPR